MIKNYLSITRNGERSASIALSCKNNSEMSEHEYDNYLNECVQTLVSFAISNKLSVLVYKVELQEIIILYFTGLEDNIEKLIKSFN